MLATLLHCIIQLGLSAFRNLNKIIIIIHKSERNNILKSTQLSEINI
jgi:hypothetical protein